MAEKKEKKPRKTRKDKGKKRGKRTKNPRLQTGSIDFRTIGTQQTFGPNLSSLVGTLASLARPIVPFQPSMPQQISSELIMRQNIPQPQERADVEQNQEETSTTEIRRAMGNRIARLTREEASLFLKGKVMEAKNILADKELQQKQMELVEQDRSMDLKRKSFLVEQIYGQSSNQVFSRVQSEVTGKKVTQKEVETAIKQLGGTDNYRTYLMEQAELNPALADYKEVKVGERGRGRKEWFYNPQKADLQRGQEERPEIEELEDSLSEQSEEETPGEPPFVPTEEFVNRVQSEMAAEQQPRMESEIAAALMQQQKINKKNEIEELAKTAISLDSRLAQRLLSIRPKLPNR